MFQEEYRVHYKVKVEGKIAYFDLRYVGDDYYYYKFEQNIIKNRKYNEKGFYTISDEEYFYGLIYHALIHKPQFSEDYKKRLEKMNPTNIKLETEEDYINLLEEWLIKNEYKITKPEDHSVQFNNENVDKFNKKVIEKNNKIVISFANPAPIIVTDKFGFIPHKLEKSIPILWKKINIFVLKTIIDVNNNEYITIIIIFLKLIVPP